MHIRYFEPALICNYSNLGDIDVTVDRDLAGVGNDLGIIALAHQDGGKSLRIVNRDEELLLSCILDLFLSRFPDDMSLVDEAKDVASLDSSERMWLEMMTVISFSLLSLLIRSLIWMIP